MGIRTHFMLNLNRNGALLNAHEEFESRRRGKSRELKFLHAWRSSLHSHLWLRSVREANKKEDFNDHIDAFLMLADGRDIPVQIKGTCEGARAFVERWNPRELGIVVVVVGDDYSPEEIIFSTIYGLELAHQRLKLEYSLVHELKVHRFLEVWRDPKDPPDWFRSVREARPDERDRYGCDAMFQRIDDFEFPVHIAHSLKDVRRVGVFERQDGIPRAAVLVQSKFSRDEIRDSTLQAVDAMRFRQDYLIGKDQRVG